MTTEIQEYVRKEKETLETPSKQTLYYIDRFKRIDENPAKINWNWSSALWGCGWMLYRRMYWETIIAVIVLILIGEISLYFVGRDISYITSFTTLGLQGNLLYNLHVKRRLKKGKTRGGVDPISPTIIAGIIILVALVSYYSM